MGKNDKKGRMDKTARLGYMAKMATIATMDKWPERLEKQNDKKAQVCQYGQ